MIALDSNQHHYVRARAARSLTRSSESSVARTLLALAASSEPALVAAAAHHLWPPSERRFLRVKRELLAYASRNPSDALRIPPLLKLLASSRSKAVRRIVTRVCRAAKTREDFVRLLNGIVASAPTGVLVQLLDQLDKRWSPQAELAIKSLLPSKLLGLFSSGWHKAYLIAVSSASNALGGIVRSQIRQIEEQAVGPVKKLAEEVRRTLDAKLTVATLLINQLGLQSFSVVRSGFSTGAQRADAMYRDLIINFGNDNHWHCGVFLGFAFFRYGTVAERQTGQFLGTNLANWPGEGMTFYSASRRLNDPAADVAGELRSLWGEFLSRFAVDSTHLYHGARRPRQGLTKSQREDVALMASNLMYNDIWWTSWDMLDWKGSGWNGSIGDIDNLRCDGVVEYAYEKNGIRVCGGVDQSLWNIGRSRKKHPKNHNEMHQWGYDPGDLCPKIQAGNQAADTRFIVPTPSQPRVRAFRVSTEAAVAGSDIATLSKIRIDFTVDSVEYGTVFVRLVVRRAGQTFNFAVTSDRWSGISASWWGVEVAEGVNHFAYWPGTRHGGGSWFGQNGDYEFQLVAIDHGGNVSDTCAVTLAIDWTSILPAPL